jgi:hypothetical protein
VSLVAWGLAPLGLFAAFHTGLDNFPLFFVAFALVAGLGLGRWPALAMVAVVAWAGTTAARARDDLGPPVDLPSRRVTALLDATCPSRRAGAECVVAVDQGLFFPGSEEPGMLELFLLREDAVRIVPLHDRRRLMAAKPAALATWHCEGMTDGRARGDERFPGIAAAREDVIARQGLAEAWSGTAEECRFAWLTPGGTVAKPERLPRGDTN